MYIEKKTIFHQTEHKRHDDDDEEKRIVKLIRAEAGGDLFFLDAINSVFILLCCQSVCVVLYADKNKFPY